MKGRANARTANVCTPGTNLEMDGKLVTQHIVESSAPTFPAEEWVKAEVEVHGSEEVIHRINGVEVLRYQRPQLDPRNEMAPATDLLNAGAAKILELRPHRAPGGRPAGLVPEHRAQIP